MPTIIFGVLVLVLALWALGVISKVDPKVGAQLSTFNRYATPNLAAREFVAPEDLKNPAIYPSPEVMKTLHFVKDLGSKTQWYDELWTQIKSK